MAQAAARVRYNYKRPPSAARKIVTHAQQYGRHDHGKECGVGGGGARARMEQRIVRFQLFISWVMYSTTAIIGHSTQTLPIPKCKTPKQQKTPPVNFKTPISRRFTNHHRGMHDPAPIPRRLVAESDGYNSTRLWLHLTYRRSRPNLRRVTYSGAPPSYPNPTSIYHCFSRLCCNLLTCRGAHCSVS